MFARLLALLATGEAAAVKRRLKTAVMFYAAAGLVALLALVFLLVALYLWAAAHWGATATALWFGVGLLIVSGLIFIAYRVTARARRRAAMGKRAESMMVGASALAMLPTLVGRRGSWTTALVLLAGLAGYAAYNEYMRRMGQRDD
ncbi:hypothetical protein [Chelativorans sp.]|uniref:hypothetical protein n=1 Tax=Chelativorans sp. TaxID=2203393 RepID=UPI002811CF17|nr:hypothetical protein [Chelativorans sp.]